jgi:RNA polymerase sigma-70 factor (ECF subfamily)
MDNKTSIQDPEQLLNSLRVLHEEGFQWALRICKGDAAAAADVLQTVYLKILEGRAVFRGASSLKTWFFSVIRLTASEQSRNRWRFFRPQEESEEPEAEQLLQDEIIEVQQHQNAWKLLFDRLSERQKQVIDLVFFHRHTIEETARILEISLGSARTHYERAKANLRMLAEKNRLFKETYHG